jgi:hypothetical protein
MMEDAEKRRKSFMLDSPVFRPSEPLQTTPSGKGSPPSTAVRLALAVTLISRLSSGAAAEGRGADEFISDMNEGKVAAQG